MIAGATPAFDIYSPHGRLMDTKGTLEEAYRCLREWHGASFVISDNRVVLHREDLDDYDTAQRQHRNAR